MSNNTTLPDSHSILQAKKNAKHLKSILRPLLPEISHSECLNIISRLAHERDWNTYLAKLKQAEGEPLQAAEIDRFIKEKAIPLITSVASKFHMKVSSNTSEIKDGERRWGGANQRTIPLRIEPQKQLQESIFCEPLLAVSETSIRLESDWSAIKLNLIFPEDAFSVLSQLITSNKISDDSEPQVLRFQSLQKQHYMFTLNASAISDTADHGLTIFTDPMTMNIFEKGLYQFFPNYQKVAKAYSALYGKWSNKKLFINLENALWKLNSDEPVYMSASSVFYSTTIAGISFSGSLYNDGPYIESKDDSVALGVCSIIRLEDGEEGQLGGYYIAKYGDKWQTHIHLKCFSESDIDKLTSEFGIPRGRFPENDTTFYQTPAFGALCSWVSKNTQFAKKMGRKGGRYLHDWYKQVLAKNLAGTVKPTNEDFLRALEKEPYLIDFGIRCTQHLDEKKTSEENLAIFQAQRTSFASSGFKEFANCCEWLSSCTKRKTINLSYSSYGLKHMVEAWAKKQGRADYYVSNGAFIAAAIHMGFDWKPDFDSPNVRFNISKKSPAILAFVDKE